MKILFSFFLILLFAAARAQSDSTIPVPQPIVADTAAEPVAELPKPKKARPVRRPVPKPVVDSARLDSLTTAAIITDSTTLSPPTPAAAAAPVYPLQSFDTAVYRSHPFYKFESPVRLISSKRKVEGKEPFFYSVVGLLLFFAFIKNAFGRYLRDLFRIFFRTTVKQRQIKESLQQSPLPSILLFLLFLLTTSLFITLWLTHEGRQLPLPFWLLFVYGIIGLACMYGLKMLGLKIIGWLFRLSDATNDYSFIVFTTNKVIGITLLPFVVILAFVQGTQAAVLLTLSGLLLGVIFLYRFFISYQTVQRQVRLSGFHFLLYLAAFEIAPLLLINKLLLSFLS